jgi:hypothetical protein
VINLDKTIKELTDRLDEVHPYSSVYSSISNHQNRNDGINYWKDKKIISIKDWNNLYQKSSTYTNTYTTILTSRKPLQYFPDDYNSSISVIGVEDKKLKEEIQKWNIDYYELLEYRKNPTLGRMKCTKCLLSGSNDDPIFIGIEKVFARIVSNQCNNAFKNQFHVPITYHCNIMNIFSCPFESIENSKYPFKRDDLFTLHQISFAIEQSISTFFEITKDNEIIYEADFVNDKVQEIHTKYNGELESWGWQKNVKEQLSKVKPISKIVIRDKQDIYDILTNREKLECLFQEYEKKNSHSLDIEGKQQVCCDENPPCVLDEKYNSNNEKDSTTTTETLDASKEKNQQLQQQVQIRQNKQNDSHKGENRHSKKTEGEEVDKENLKINLKTKIKGKLENRDKEQQILLIENKQKIIDFLLDNTDSIRIEDLKIYEPIYKCYRQKGNCQMCNSLSNIVCMNCNHYKNEVWLCINHWQQHAIENH